MTMVLGLVVATFLSEDLACLAAAALIARGEPSPWAGIATCASGIFVGDLGLWAIGRFGGQMALSHSRLSRWLAPSRTDACRRWLERHAGGAILASRFTPGARLPLYVTAGLVRMSPARFAAWTLLASVVWTPVVVLASAQAGQAAQRTGAGAAWVFAVVAACLAAVSSGVRLAWSPARRDSVVIALRRLTRWEFWPSWVFYPPVALWVLTLAVRYRGLTTITTSNPGMPDGGLVGESKADILRQLPPEWTIPFVTLAAGGPGDPVAAALAHMSGAGWAFPVVLKPDVGQRGVGVRLVRSAEGLADYLSSARGDVLMQPYHEGPFEAGIFYYRIPGERHGRIFSITDKRFPVIVGDGTSTVADLIQAHARYRLQASLFLRRHHRVSHTVLAPGERLQLAMAGNHAQGTMFCDGAHLWTRQLEQRVDAIARAYPGFFIGRFDVRYRDVDAFKAGSDLAVVELNGATAESTNIYDPGTRLLDAYRVLFRQWALVFAIGATNRAHGATPTPSRRLAHLVLSHLMMTSPHAMSD